MQTLIGNAKILTKNRSLIKRVANTCEVCINVSKHNPLSVVRDVTVCYKGDGAPEWKGPHRVLDQDDPVIFICHGFHYIKAHTCCVQPITVSDSNNV